MLRFLAGAASCFLLLTGAFLIWQSHAEQRTGLPAAPAAGTYKASMLTGQQPLEAPEASPKSREQKRFSRYDHDKDGKVESGEYLAARQRNFEKLDDWNTVEIIAKDDRLAFLVNGRLVNSLFNIQAPDPPAPENAGPNANAAQAFPTGGNFRRLDRGKVALEIEFAEIWYRNVQIRPLGAGD